MDDAHSFGVFGEDGSGIESHFGLRGKIDIVTGSLSKALGAQGGFICASQAIVDYLEHFSREFVYTTTLPTAICAGVLEGIRIMKESGNLDRKKLWDNTRQLQKGLREIGMPIGSTQSPIVPIYIGDEKIATEMAHKLMHVGVFVNVAARPAVKRNEARLRLSVNAHHTEEQIDYAIKSIRTVSDGMGLKFNE